jgi:hypothetical protein
VIVFPSERNERLRCRTLKPLVDPVARSRVGRIFVGRDDVMHFRYRDFLASLENVLDGPRPRRWIAAAGRPGSDFDIEGASACRVASRWHVVLILALSQS